jgi:hypothetical protein
MICAGRAGRVRSTGRNIFEYVFLSGDLRDCFGRMFSCDGSLRNSEKGGGGAGEVVYNCAGGKCYTWLLGCLLLRCEHGIQRYMYIFGGRCGRGGWVSRRLLIHKGCWRAASSQATCGAKTLVYPGFNPAIVSETRLVSGTDWEGAVLGGWRSGGECIYGGI